MRSVTLGFIALFVVACGGGGPSRSPTETTTPPGNVARGTVAFGSSGSLATCTVDFKINYVPAFGEMVWMASLTRQVTPSDEVRLRIIVSGTEVSNEVQDPGTYDCLGTEEPVTDIRAGIYTYQVLVNGQVDATGTVLVS